MGIRSMVSFGLFVLPIAVTIGILLGIDLPRRSSGQQSIFAPPPVTKITTDEFCQLSYGFTPKPGRYIYNPNQWGITSGSGNLCMNVTFWENGTYPTKTQSANFTATWEYPQGPESQPVHAFPNAKIVMEEIINASTVQISNLTSMPVELSWAYGGGEDMPTTADAAALYTANMNANVCFDMFLDTDPVKAVSTNTSGYEIMIWFGAYGLSTQPIGNLQGLVTSQTVNGTTFNLYDGENSSTKQKVFTWVVSSNTTEFAGDIAPLLANLEAYGGPTSADHLGYMAFGSEALYATSTVTFSVKTLNVDVITG